MTEQEVADETAETEAPLELPVILLGREIFVRMPSPEQLLVWDRTVKRLTNAPVDASWTGSEVMAALERLRKIVDTLLVNRIDADWMDDQFLDQTLDFQKLAPFIAEVVAAFQEYAAANGNREERRAAKTKKATRKKAS
jgi:hypothetical protein